LDQNFFSDSQQKMIEAIVTGFGEDMMAAIPAVDKTTGKTVPILSICTDDDTFIPVALIFTPKEDDLSRYQFPDELEDVETTEGVNFVYSASADKEVENLCIKDKTWLEKVKNFLHLGS